MAFETDPSESGSLNGPFLPTDSLNIADIDNLSTPLDVDNYPTGSSVDIKIFAGCIVLTILVLAKLSSH